MGEAAARLDEVLDAPSLPSYWEAALRIQRAEYERYLRRWRKALDDLERAEELLGDDDYQRKLRCHVYGIRGELYLDCGLVDVAARWLDEERAHVEDFVARGVAAPVERRNAILHEAHLALATSDAGRLRELVAVAQADEELYRAAPGQRAKLSIRLGIALSEEELLDPERERRAARLLAEALSEPSLPDVERPQAELVLARIAIREERFEDAESWLASVERRRAPGAATDLSAARATLALDRGDGREALAAAHARLRASFDELVADWRATEPRPGGYGIFHFSSARTVLAELVRALVPLEGSEAGARAGLEAYVTAQGLGSLARALDAPDTSIDAICAELLDGDPAAGLLAYLPAAERSWVFLLDGSGRLELVELGMRDAIEAARRELVRALIDPAGLLGTRPGEEAGRRRARRIQRARVELARLLLPAPVQARLARWSRLSLVGMDLLGEVPFECMPLGEEPFLGTAKAVDALPSLPAALALARRPRPEASDAVWLLADPRVAPDVQARWPHVAELGLEADAVRALAAAYRPDRRRILAREQATAEALGAPEIGSAAVLELFTHGVHDPSRERPGALVLAPESPDDDGLLWADEVERLAAPPCVLLFACKTGRAPLRRGDPGAADLGGAFLLAGARVVALSSFDMEVEAARRMSRTVHEALVAGASPAEAARRARAELAADPRFADPAYHGLLRVVGLGHRPVFPEAGPR